MATDKNYPIDLPILVIEAQIFVAVNKFQFLPNKLIPSCQPSAQPTLAILRGWHHSGSLMFIGGEEASVSISNDK